MQNDNLPTLQQKIQSSRKIWTSYQNDKFIDRLYKILDNPSYYAIISWSADGSQVGIKDEHELETHILPLFKNCPTLSIFKQKLEECFFFEAFDDFSQFRTCCYEHLSYTRDSRPKFFNDRLDNKSKKAVRSISQKLGSLEWYFATKKIIHKENINDLEMSLKNNENDGATLSFAERELFNEMDVNFLELNEMLTTIQTLRKENLMLRELIINSTFQGLDQL